MFHVVAFRWWNGKKLESRGFKVYYDNKPFTRMTTRARARAIVKALN